MLDAPLPLSAHYDPAQAAAWAYRPDETALATAAAAWRRTHGLKPAGADERRVRLLLIDVQKDFCFPEGSLYVAGRSGTGAVDDSRRIAELVYRNLGAITDITTTMDTHFAYQLFFPAFWVDRDDQPLTAHRVITAEQIGKGEVRPIPAVAKWLCGGNYAWLCKQVRFYCDELEKAGKYQLYLWPPHCLTYVLMEVLQEATYTLHHIQKVVGFFAAMRAFAESLKRHGHRVLYLPLDDRENKQTFEENIRLLIRQHGFERFEYQLPDDYRLDLLLKSLEPKPRIPVSAADSEHFLSDRASVQRMFTGKKRFLMESFYRHMRVKHDVLMEGGKPSGGEWNFDRENRQKYDGRVLLPSPKCFLAGSEMFPEPRVDQEVAGTTRPLLAVDRFSRQAGCP